MVEDWFGDREASSSWVVMEQMGQEEFVGQGGGGEKNGVVVGFRGWGRSG